MRKWPLQRAGWCLVVVLCDKPRFACPAKNPAAKRGYAYERKVERHVQRIAAAAGLQVWTQQWLFCEGVYACPDLVLISPSDCALICEIKLTWCDTSAQRAKYEALLRRLGYTTCSLTICRNLTPFTNKALVVPDLHDAFPDSVVHLWL